MLASLVQGQVAGIVASVELCDSQVIDAYFVRSTFYYSWPLVVRNFIMKQLMTLNHGKKFLCRICSNLGGYDNEGWYDNLVVSRITRLCMVAFIRMNLNCVVFDNSGANARD